MKTPRHVLSLEIALLFHLERFWDFDQGTKLQALCETGTGSEHLTTLNVTFAVRAIASALKDLAFRINIILPSSITGDVVVWLYRDYRPYRTC